MKHKTSELEGELLDKAVIKALGGTVYDRRQPILQDLYGAAFTEWNFPVACAVVNGDSDAGRTPFSPTRWWEHGGPILERERISLLTVTVNWGSAPAAWAANVLGKPAPYQTGRTMLEAGMRAFVASKMGDEVELP